MAMQSNPSVRTDEKTNQELYQKAAEFLDVLFGTAANPASGIFQQEPLPAGFKSRTEFVRSIMDAPSNKAFFDALPQPYANSLATVYAARGNPRFSPEIVVEFASRRPEEGEDKYDDTASRTERLKLLAEIAALTRDPATGNSRVALKLPFNGKLDFPGSTIGVFKALATTEREIFVKLGLDKVEPGGGFREFSSENIVEELIPRTLTPMQRFYLRVRQWDEQREAVREDRERRRGQHGSRDDDPAAALPQATPAAPKPEPKPEAPAPAAGPIIPDLSALISGGPTPAAPIRTPRANKKAVVVAPVAPAVVPTTAPSAEAGPAAPTATMSPEVLAAVLDEGSARAKAMAYLFRKDKKTRAEAEALAKAENLL